MLDFDQFMNIRFLHRQGHSVRAIARLTGHSRNTVRRLLRAPRAPVAAPRVRPSKLDPYKDYLISRWQAHGLSAVRLQPEIAAQGFTGSVKIVRRFLQTLRAERRIDSRLTVRFETPPGEQAQCDWAEVGRYLRPHYADVFPATLPPHKVPQIVATDACIRYGHVHGERIATKHLRDGAVTIKYNYVVALGLKAYTECEGDVSHERSIRDSFRAVTGGAIVGAGLASIRAAANAVFCGRRAKMA